MPVKHKIGIQSLNIIPSSKKAYVLSLTLHLNHIMCFVKDEN